MTYDLTRRAAPLCALLFLCACMTSPTPEDADPIEDKVDREPEVANVPEEPPSFCPSDAREVQQREYRWCSVDGAPHGPYEAIRDGVVLLQGEFADGLMSGEWTGYHADGSVRWKATFEQGEEIGEVQGWRPDGSKLYTIAFDEGVHEGATTYFHGNGERSAEVTFAEGEPSGTWTYFHENGEKAHELSWAKGKESIHRHWTEAGKKTSSPKGRLSKSAVQRVANSIDDAIIDCYKHTRAFDQVEGKLVVQFTIDYSGDVNRVSAISNDFANPFMSSCAMRAIEALEFPLNPYGPQRVIRTWDLGVQ
jgi:hypothetical protein